MMLSLSRKTVRQTWRPYAGAFVALACGVVLIAVAVTLIGAVDQTARRSGVTADQKTQLDDLAAMFGMMSGVALFMAIFVVASTFGFVVAARRR
jgi:putative ABC transport system permease protein